MRRLLFALALLVACPSTSLHSTVVPGLAAWTEGRLNSQQTCQRAPELLACAEKQSLYLFDQAVLRGLAKSAEDARKKWGHPMLCLVERREPCCLGETCVESSRPELQKVPRAACTFYNATWIARLGEAELPYDYSSTLFTELKSSMGWALGVQVDAHHATSWDLIPYPGGELACDWRR
jgi:hypothetical protein